MPTCLAFILLSGRFQVHCLVVLQLQEIVAQKCCKLTSNFYTQV